MNILELLLATEAQVATVERITVTADSDNTELAHYEVTFIADAVSEAAGVQSVTVTITPEAYQRYASHLEDPMYTATS